MNKRQCECCLGIYATGKNYGDFWQQNITSKPIHEVKGLCEFCNQNSKWFSCKKHGVPFKIGHTIIQGE